MSGLYLEFGLLLICSIFRYTEGTGKGQCPSPDPVKFAEYSTDWYVVGTRSRYLCDEGYKRKAGTSNFITCEERSGIAKWTYNRPPACIGLSPTAEWENSSIGPPVSTPTVMEGFCGAPIPYKHATVKVEKYKVGQKLKFKCFNRSHAQTPITEIITCENSSGNGVWSSLKLRCSSDPILTSGKQYLNAATLFIMAVVTTVFVL